MIQSVLFTKKVDVVGITAQLGNNLKVESKPTLAIELTPVDEIQSKLLSTCKHYIVTSQNSVKAIQSLSLDGSFYVVGKKTANQLKELGFHVEGVADYAKDLIPLLLQQHETKSWNFFCGNTRRAILVDELKKHQHHVNEIVTYQSSPIEYQLNQTYDAYVFFSPLSFQTFVKNNIIPTNSTIFTIGKTTSTAVEEVYPTHTIITASTPMLEVVVNNIKDCINDKK